jgi:hypothetical protein
MFQIVQPLGHLQVPGSPCLPKATIKPALIGLEYSLIFTELQNTHQNASLLTQNFKKSIAGGLRTLEDKVFGQEFGKTDGIVRAERRPYIPVVLSRAEIDRYYRIFRRK